MFLMNKQVTHLLVQDRPAGDRDTPLGFLALAAPDLGGISPVQNGGNYWNGKQRVHVGAQAPWHLTRGSPSWCTVCVPQLHLLL